MRGRPYFVVWDGELLERRRDTSCDLSRDTKHWEGHGSTFGTGADEVQRVVGRAAATEQRHGRLVLKKRGLYTKLAVSPFLSIQYGTSDGPL